MNQFLKIQNEGRVYMPTNRFPVLSIWEKKYLYSLSCQIGFITPNSNYYKPRCNNLIMLLEGISTLKTKNKELSAKSVFINEILFYLARFYSSSVKNLKLHSAEKILCIEDQYRHI
ncbi:hypothetical protein A3860_17780 [Niastella vici]|uniref:Uncharacterized protein n=1 Tax=Niastella vici TaxID=1703345 RepID=A0A1V9G4D5_9BACT|nr:hypothetical protein A3860_17780 [Niastella vici]